MNTYRKKSIEVSALQWTAENAEEMIAFTGEDFFVPLYDAADYDSPYTAKVYDALHDSWVLLSTGDYVIRGIKGEFYPCRSDVFESTYDLVQA